MTPDDIAAISGEIDRAFAMAERGAEGVAVQAFATTRAMCVELADPDALARKVATFTKGFAGERERYRAMLADRFGTGRTVTIFGDSLGLPRPDDVDGEYAGADRIYPYLLGEHFGDRAIQSYCQRFFTTQDVLALLLADPDLGRDSDVLVHVGLNDCATRTFSEEERLSLDLLPAELKTRIVTFGQRYRRAIVQQLPASHYVSPANFSGNLDAILTLLQDRGANAVLTTVIMPFVRFWAHTPGVQRNFTDYNLRVMNAAARHDATVLQMDRLVWDQQHTGVLLADGMHLSLKGHQLLTRFAAPLLT